MATPTASSAETTHRCPTCGTEVEPPRAAYFVPGNHQTSCPNGHPVTFTLTIDPAPPPAAPRP